MTEPLLQAEPALVDLAKHPTIDGSAAAREHHPWQLRVSGTGATTPENESDSPPEPVRSDDPLEIDNSGRLVAYDPSLMSRSRSMDWGLVAPACAVVIPALA